LGLNSFGGDVMSGWGTAYLRYFKSRPWVGSRDFGMTSSGPEKKCKGQFLCFVL